MLLVMLAASLAAADDRPIVPPGAKLEKVWTGNARSFTEGPACGPDGCVYFSDIGTSTDSSSSNAIMKFDPATGKTTVFRKPAGRANGLDFDLQGRLVACEGAGTGGNRRVTRTEKDGKITVLADKYMGKRFNSPNDLTIDLRGRIYFTDPRYGANEGRELDHESVYRIDTNGKVTRIISDVEKPNGVILSPDMKTLYVAESNYAGKRQLLAYPLNADGSVGKKKVLHDFGKDRGIDGMCVDEKGRIFAAAGRDKTARVQVFDPAGKEIASIAVPEMPTNCVFAGKERSTLYVTAGKSLYRITLNTRGFAVYWPKE
jgi:gluconolactonase